MGKVKQMLTDEQQEYVEGLRCELSEAERLMRNLMVRLDNHFGGVDRSQDWQEQSEVRAFLAKLEGW